MLALGAILLAGITISGRALLRMVAGGHSPLTFEHTQIVGETIFLVPENTIRHQQARRSGKVASLELYMLWPSLAGYSPEESAAFNHANGRKEIIFASVAPNATPEMAADRIQNSYLELTEESHPGPAGLEFRQFQKGGGFLNEVLAVGNRTPQAAFIARCLTEEMAALSLAPCERRLPFTEDLSLTYRFPEALLPEWQVLDEKLLKRLNAMLQK